MTIWSGERTVVFVLELREEHRATGTDPWRVATRLVDAYGCSRISFPTHPTLGLILLWGRVYDYVLSFIGPLV